MASYFQTPLGINHIPNFLRASSPRALRRLMLRNNTRHSGFVKYFNIQYVESDKSWYAWFFVTEEEFAQLENQEGDE